MYELLQISKNDFYVEGPAKVGLIKINETDVIAIDSGSDKDSAKKILRQIEENGWVLKQVILTHSHADHVGGNRFLQEKTNCKSYAFEIESIFSNNPILEPSTLFGGFPFTELRNKFLMAQPSLVEPLSQKILPPGFEIISLPGHSSSQIGIRTPDNNIFLADCLISKETLNKYGISYLWDVKSYLETLENVKQLKANYFIPSHAPVTEDITELAQYNIDCVIKTISTIKKILQTPMPFDVLLQSIFNEYGLTMTVQQHELIGSTIRSYLSYLKNENQVEYIFENNLMLWKAK